MKGYDVTANARSRIDIRGRYQHWVEGEQDAGKIVGHCLSSSGE